MADDSTTEQQPTGEEQPAGGFKPITSQEDLNRIIGERVARTKAQFGDYDDLRAKAARLDEIEQANLSEAEKAASRIAALERELEATRSGALRARIQAKFGIADEDADLFLTATDEDTLTKQAERLAERRTKTANRDPFAGRTPTTAGDDPMREFARQLIKRD
ncbi:hypothetical protein [Cellulomonas shaoxiangyii]|uniref:DUF4355 domain-containing protein n=1 Tax=Cellulomonas shaoxiangyii TaxID=2566013 RepID=A0A4V1CMK9_9CELL|nr:hypothetical protein [Cellulomonas shaoxiangyii]QCB93305.1 hypothetical protein E5225_06820 [Cellulomonas shaoxiangyii]TGY82476.1 hypothetical protein E5226_13130 [Cellulomonas shaoxiangyii]